MMIQCENLVKIYKISNIEVVALQGLDLEVESGEMMAIIGNSGSGKSTLLNMLGALDQPSAGKIIVDGKNLIRMKDKDLVKYKRETVGFVWQNNARNLVPYLTALENVELPMLLNRGKNTLRAKELLELVGLEHRMNNKLTELSGGEQQRVAIAIALANNPRLLLADEPTGSVDTKMAKLIMDTFRELNRVLGLTVVIVTHDMQLAKKVDRVVAIRDGKTSSEILRRSNVELESDLSWENGKEDVDSHIELSVLDRAGRLQIPENYLQSVGLEEQRKVRVELENGKIVIFPYEGKKVYDGRR